MSSPVDYIVDLTHLGKSIFFTKASSSRSAVTHILARHFGKENLRLKMHDLDKNGDAGNCAFMVPRIVAEDKKPIPQAQYELLQEMSLASEIAIREKGPERKYLPRAKKLLEAYKLNRIQDQQPY